MRAKSPQLRLTLCDPTDCSPPDSSVHGILQARILEWIAMPSSGDLPNPGKEPASPVIPALQVDSVHAEPPGKPLLEIYWDLNYICKGSFSQIRENIHSFQELGYWANPLGATHYRSFPCTRHCPKHLICINPSISQQPNDIGYYFGPYWGKEAQSH